MAAEKPDPSALGLACVCLYWNYHLVDKESDPCFFWHRKRRRVYEYPRVPTAGAALVPNYALDLWFYFWAVPLFLGKGKAIGAANWESF